MFDRVGSSVFDTPLTITQPLPRDEDVLPHHDDAIRCAKNSGVTLAYIASCYKDSEGTIIGTLGPCNFRFQILDFRLGGRLRVKSKIKNLKSEIRSVRASSLR